MKKIIMVIVSIFMFTIMVNGQNPVVNSGNQSGINQIDNVIALLKGLNNDNLTLIIGTLEKLSNELLNSKTETLEVQNLSSKEVVSVLDNAIFSLDKLNGTCSFDSVISNLKEVSKQYENTSYENLRENVR